MTRWSVARRLPGRYRVTVDEPTPSRVAGLRCSTGKGRGALTSLPAERWTAYAYPPTLYLGVPCEAGPGATPYCPGSGVGGPNFCASDSMSQVPRPSIGAASQNLNPIVTRIVTQRGFASRSCDWGTRFYPCGRFWSCRMLRHMHRRASGGCERRGGTDGQDFQRSGVRRVRRD